jgi:putative membrane protein
MITGVVAAAMLAAAPGALAQVTSSPDPAASPWPNVRPGANTGTAVADSVSIRQAISGNFLEVGLGRTAESRAEDSDVKAFAERMVSEHNSMNDQWAALARKNDMRIELDAGPTGEQVMKRLEGLDGAAFDQAYMAEMIRDHEQDLAAFQRMEASAGSPEVRQLANSGVSTIREHLALARQVGSRVGVSTTAARAGNATERDDGTRWNDRSDRDDRNDRDNNGRTLRAEDRAFVENVLQDHLMHIRLAERARREARSDDTRRLAKQMKEDFEKWQERWKDVAHRFDVTTTSRLGRPQEQKVERLERASKRNVDHAYTAIVTEQLESAVPYFQPEGRAVRSAAVRRLVEEELPVIREHLARARRLQAQASARAEASERE